MLVPTLTGVIDRRILANYRVDPDRLAAILPPPFRPALVDGHGIAGVCLLRLARLRPPSLPAWTGLTSENAAHRVAVEWDTRDGTARGVYIPRRDTASRLNRLAGGRVFPGQHYQARVRAWEHGGRYRVAVDSDDGRTHVLVDACSTGVFPAGSVFGSLERASAFFERGRLGWSPTTRPGCYDGMELTTSGWHVQPLAVARVESSFFDDRGRFPTGSVTFDCALLMTGVEHRWQAHPRLLERPAAPGTVP